MDIRKEILKEHSKTQCDKITRYVGSNVVRFNELMAIYFDGPQVVTQRAAWPVSRCIENHPQLIKPHLSKMLNFLQQPGIHDAVKRGTMRCLLFVDVPKKYHGKLVQHCFDFIENKSEAVAIKVFSMMVLSSIIKDEPDLKKELRIIIEDQMPYATAAFRSRGRKVLKELDR